MYIGPGYWTHGRSKEWRQRQNLFTFYEIVPLLHSEFLQPIFGDLLSCLTSKRLKFSNQKYEIKSIRIGCLLRMAWTVKHILVLFCSWKTAVFTFIWNIHKESWGCIEISRWRKEHFPNLNILKCPERENILQISKYLETSRWREEHSPNLGRLSRPWSSSSDPINWENRNLKWI